MKEATVTLLNRAGLHARPASLIAQIASASSSEVLLCFGGECVNAKSIMGIITLGAPYQAQLTLKVNGPDEDAVIARISHLFGSRFEEE
jgi:phosphocarrier protein HPr